MTFMKIPTAALVVLACAAGSATAGTFRANFAMPVQISVSSTTTGCTNAPGPQITVWGEMDLSALDARLTFQNNEKGTHTTSDGVHVDAAVVANGQKIVIPKQPSRGGVGGNPFIWMQLIDGSGRALSTEQYLGRCVQGNFKGFAQVLLPVTAVADYEVSGCTNNPGPTITMSGDLECSADVRCRMIFRNSDNKVGGPHQATADQTVDITLIQAGQIVSFPKQPVLGGVGGNPWIYFQWMQGSGVPVGQETLLGRCVQLSNGS